ncbi:MAG: XrtA/PEP-CTERM system histidine kinase PrsK, partial [Nitrospirales bacterium]
ATAVMQMGNGLGLMDPSHALGWRRLALLGELGQPVALLYAGLTLMRSENLGLVQAARWRARAVALLAVGWGICAWSNQVYAFMDSGQALARLGLGSLGRVAYAFILVSLVLALTQLEQILRAARDPLRWQLKFVLIGLGALGGYSIYQASRLLLVPVWQIEYVLSGGLAALISVSLIGYGLGRSRLQEFKAKVYVSPQVLYGSITFLVVGLYLLTVGVIAEMMRYTGQPLTVVLSSALVFAAVVLLTIVLFSRSVRAELRRFIARHFYRSKYDYRAKWIEVSEAFRAAASVEAILDQLLQVLGHTFGAARISIWMPYDADGRFHQVRRLGVTRSAPPLDGSHPVMLRLMATDDPLELAEVLPSAQLSDSTGSSSFLDATHAVLCVPIRSEGNMLALITLSRELRGERYGTDDHDLLRAICRHVGVLLSHAHLAEERRDAVELEALHRFSAFCLHDLKNLTARLSLVVQNAEVHGEDPDFRQSAMRTVAGTVQKMMALITKISRKTVDRSVPEVVDMAEVIAETVGSINGSMRVPIEATGERVLPVCIAREQLQQVLLNVLLNARQAIEQVELQAGGERGRIRIRAEQVNGSVVVTVADTGPGISTAELRTLFHPFRTTKREGLGIGLYECKQVIEAHQGTIRVESELGRGTQVRIELPIAAQGEGYEKVKR